MMRFFLDSAAATLITATKRILWIGVKSSQATACAGSNPPFMARADVASSASASHPWRDNHDSCRAAAGALLRPRWLGRSNGEGMGLREAEPRRSRADSKPNRSSWKGESAMAWRAERGERDARRWFAGMNGSEISFFFVGFFCLLVFFLVVCDSKKFEMRGKPQ